MRRLAFGLVGYGAWGRHHAQVIRNTPECELRAVCARTPEVREQAARETGATTCADFRELVARSDLDIIDIVVPNYLHEAVACAGLEAGKHVLLEKPMSTSVAACDRILETARRSQKLLLVGHEMRFSPLYVRIRELIEAGQIGEPRYVLVDLWRRPYRPGAGEWRIDPERVGSWTLEEPVHYFDAAAWFLEGAGEPSTIYAKGNRGDARLAYHAAVNDNFTAVVGYSKGAYAVISQTLAAVEHHLSIKAFGSEAMLRAEWHATFDRSEHPSYALEISEQGGMKELAVPGTPGELFELRQEIAALARAVREGTRLPITPEEGRRAVLLCMEAQRSLETGQVIRLGPAN